MENVYGNQNTLESLYQNADPAKNMICEQNAPLELEQ